MIQENTRKIIEEIQQGKGLSEIAREHNCSRQLVHQIKVKVLNDENYGKESPKRKQKKLSKKELKLQLDEMQKVNLRLQEELSRQEQQKWESCLPIAFERIRAVLMTTFCGTATLLKFEHVDGSGYWFTFELTNDSRRQTYCVRHDEI